MNLFGNKTEGTKTSSFWLDPIYFKGSAYQSKAERESGDLLKLSSVRRSISNFVTIVTGKNIPVKFMTSGGSKTDGNVVTISADLAQFDTVCGLALHEASHIKLSNFKILKQLQTAPVSFFKTDWLDSMAGKYSMSRHEVAKLMAMRLKMLINYIEDRRIDNFIFTTAPGYQGYYESMYDEYWNSPMISKGLKSAAGRDEAWESYEFRVINFTNPDTDFNALKGLKLLWDVADLKNIGRLKSTKDVINVATEMLTIIEKHTKNNPPKDDDKDGEGEAGDGDGDGESDNGTSESKKSDKQSKQDSDGKDNSNGDKSDEDGDPKDGKSDTAENSQGTPKADKTSDRGTPQSAPPLLSDVDINELREAIERQKNFMAGDVDKKELSDEKKDMVEAMEEAGTEEKQVAKGDGGLRNGNPSCPVVVMKTFNERILKSDPFSLFLSRPQFQDEVNEGMKLGTMLGRRIQIRNEARSLKTTRLRNGKIDERLIASLGYGAEQVFERTFVDVFNPLHLHISIDASGSMSGRKWTRTMVAVVAICKAASMVSNLSVVVSFRYTAAIEGGYYNHKPLVLIAYDSRKDDITKVKKLFPYLTAPSATPEGLCFEALTDIMVDGSATQESYFINFSDGEPYFSNNQISYSGDTARRHTKKQVDAMRARGIKVLSYFIGGSSDVSSHFKMMYGKDAVNVDVNSLIALAKTLNKLFTKK